jgi:catechol 2,3-dioxygenase-like lactoylglutathione lyase family enzyme
LQIADNARPPAPASELFPILETPDPARSVAFYRDLLGGVVAYEFRGPDGDIVYAGLDMAAPISASGRTRMRRLLRLE